MTARRERIEIGKPHTFTLAGLFTLMTFATIFLALGRAVGFLASGLFLLAPVPLIGYMILVRQMMARFEVAFESRWLLVNFGLSIGLIVAGLFSLTVLVAALVAMA